MTTTGLNHIGNFNLLDCCIRYTRYTVYLSHIRIEEGVIYMQKRMNWKYHNWKYHRIYSRDIFARIKIDLFRNLGLIYSGICSIQKRLLLHQK